MHWGSIESSESPEAAGNNSTRIRITANVPSVKTISKYQACSATYTEQTVSVDFWSGSHPSDLRLKSDYFPVQFFSLLHRATYYFKYHLMLS